MRCPHNQHAHSAFRTEHNSPSFLSAGCAQWLHSKEDSVERKRKGKLQRGDTDRCCLSPMAKVGTRNIESRWQNAPSIWREANGISPLRSSSQKQITQVHLWGRWEKHQTGPNGGTFNKKSDQSCSKLSRSLKTRALWETVSQEEPKETWQLNPGWNPGIGHWNWGRNCPLD